MSFTKQLKFMIEAKQNEAVKLILEDSRLYHSVTNEGSTLLHYAAEYGNINITKYLLDKGCNIEAEDSEGDTPLMVAVSNRHGGIVKKLLAAGADVDFQNKNEVDALSLALETYPVESTFRQLFRALLKKHSSKYVARRLVELNCPLDTAVYSRDTKIVEYMIKRGVPVKFPYKTDQFPLHIAVEYCDVEMVKVLLKYGADIDAKDDEGKTPVAHLYSRKSSSNDDRLEILKILLEKGICQTSCDDYGHFQVRQILSQGNWELIRIILLSNFDFNAKETDTGGTPLHVLMKNRNPGIIDELKRYVDKFDFEVQNVFQEKPLHWAIRKGNVKMVEFLLSQGVEADAIALHDAYTTCSNVQSEMEILLDRCAELLLRHNADPRVIFTDEIMEKTELCFDRIKLAIAQLAIIERQGTAIDEPIYSIINSNCLLDTYLGECRRLLDKKILNSVSVFELLCADDKIITKYFNNDELVREFKRMFYGEELKSISSYYKNILKRRFCKGMANKELRGKVAGIICEISGHRLNIRHIVTEIVIDYLSEQDLQKLHAFLTI